MLTGKKGAKLYKGQIVDGKELVDGSIDHLKSLGSISEVEEKKEESKKAPKKEDKPE